MLNQQESEALCRGLSLHFDKLIPLVGKLDTALLPLEGSVSWYIPGFTIQSQSKCLLDQSQRLFNQYLLCQSPKNYFQQYYPICGQMVLNDGDPTAVIGTQGWWPHGQVCLKTALSSGMKPGGWGSSQSWEGGWWWQIPPLGTMYMPECLVQLPYLCLQDKMCVNSYLCKAKKKKDEILKEPRFLGQ